MAEDYGVVIMEEGRCRFASGLMSYEEARAFRVKMWGDEMFNQVFRDACQIVPAEELRQCKRLMLKGG